MMKPSETIENNGLRPATAITLAMTMLLASLGTSIANIALPSLARAFSAPFASVQAVVIAYLAALTITVVVAGRLGDRFGLKPMLIAGLVLFTLASVLCALAPSLAFLVAARALQGVGAAFLMTLSMAMMRQSAGPENLGRAMGLLGTVSALGTAIGPSVGGLIISAGGWQGIFWLQVPLSATALGLAITVLPRASKEPDASPASLLSVLNRRLVPGLFVNMLVAAVMMTTLVVGPFYLGLGLGLSGPQTGFVMAIGPVISIFSGLPAGKLVDAWGSLRVVMTGLALLALGALLLAFLPGMIGVAGYVLPIVILTPGYQLFQAANNTAVLADVPKMQRGTVSGALNLSRNIGLIAGASLMGMVFASGTGTADFSHASPVAIAAGFQLTFLAASGLVMLAVTIQALVSYPLASRSPARRARMAAAMKTRERP